jgi:hypothetical protein
MKTFRVETKPIRVGNPDIEVKMNKTGVADLNIEVKMKHTEQKMKPTGVRIPDVEIKMNETDLLNPNTEVKMNVIFHFDPDAEEKTIENEGGLKSFGKSRFAQFRTTRKKNGTFRSSM